MDFNLTPTKLIDQLRAWFHPKDRSVFIAEDCFIDMDEQTTPTTPTIGRRRLYPKDAGWYELDDAGTESPLGGSLIVHDHSTALLGGQNLRSIQELEFDNYSKLTIAAGVVTRTQVYHSIDTEAAAATDDLDTINGGTEADLLITRQDNDARNIKYTLAGNLEIPSGIDLYSDLANQAFGWIFDGQNWLNFANPFGRSALIAETILSGSVASVTFASIPQTFRHLVLYFNARGDVAGSQDVLGIRFNADGAGNYDHILLRGNNGAASSISTFAATSASLARFSGNTATAGVFGGGVIFFPNYTSANFNKLGLGISLDMAATGAVSSELTFYGGQWRNTTATTSITGLPILSANFLANSIFALYGIL